MKIEPITGQTFNRLTAVAPSIRILNNGQRVVYWECACSCGKNTSIAQRHLIKGNTMSCGCLRNEKSSARAKERNLTHGLSKHPVFAVWSSMIQRCINPNKDCFSLYGGRGIKVCKRWETFELFIDDMGIPEKGMTLDRINTDGDYEPGNCRWTNWKTQQRNRRNNRFVTIGDKTMTIAEWSELTGIRQDTLSFRIKSGWPEHMLLSPVKSQLQPT